METQTITKISKTRTMVLCCLITLFIAATVSFAGQVNIRGFVNNILAWNTI